MIVLPVKIYAQSAIDINNSPVIIMDKQAIEIDRRILKSTQASGAQEAIKFARQRFDQRKKHNRSRERIEVI